jgi:MFS family permease
MAPFLRDRFDLTLGQAGVLISASFAGSVVTLIPLGLLADRLGERPVLVVGVGLCGIALLGASEAHGF